MVYMRGKRDKVVEGLDVAGAHPPAVGAHGAADERGVLVVLDEPAAPVGRQPGLDSGRRFVGAAAGTHADRPLWRWRASRRRWLVARWRARRSTAARPARASRMACCIPLSASRSRASSSGGLP